MENEKELTAYALPRIIIAFLDVQYNVDENNTPSDHDYFLALLAVETCRALIYHLGDENQCEYFQLDTDKLEKRKTLGESLIELLDKLTEKREALLKKMVDCKQKPLVEKFLDALDANEDERKIFRFVLCINMIRYLACRSGFRLFVTPMEGMDQIHLLVACRLVVYQHLLILVRSSISHYPAL